MTLTGRENNFDDTFSRFDTTHECTWQTDRQTGSRRRRLPRYSVAL